MKQNNRFFKYLKKFAKEIKKDGERAGNIGSQKIYKLTDGDYTYILGQDKKSSQFVILENTRSRLNVTVASFEITKDGNVTFRDIPKSL